MNRVIHRSLLFDALAIQKRSLLREILKVIAAQAVKTSTISDAIRKVKETLGTEKKTELHLLDQLNADGDTLLHITTRVDDDEATQMLLDHGADPNVHDSE